MKAPDKKPGFVIRVDDIAFLWPGKKPIAAYVALDRYGPAGLAGSDGFVTDIELASKVERLPVVNAWLEKHPSLALKARIIHYPTMVVVCP